MEKYVWSNHLLLNVALFLPLRDVLISLARTSSVLGQKVRDLLAVLIRSHIVNGNEFLQRQNSADLKRVLTDPIHLLKFKPLYYNGGVSNLEVKTSFEALWEYSGTAYSTFYSRSGGSLLPNRLCAAYFAGVPGMNLMAKRFHYDLTMLVRTPHILGDTTREVLKSHAKTALTFGYLYPEEIDEFPPEVVVDTDTFYAMMDEIETRDSIDPMEKLYPYEPDADSICIIRAIAIARGLNFTGSVKTMMLIAGMQSGDVYEPGAFRKWEDIDTLEKASRLPLSHPKQEIEGVDCIEFSPIPYTSTYPLLWLHFPDSCHNHVTVSLSRPHIFRQITAIFYTIEDTRIEYNLSGTQPNFDLMFIVFLGTIVEKNKQ